MFHLLLFDKTEFTHAEPYLVGQPIWGSMKQHKHKWHMPQTARSCLLWCGELAYHLQRIWAGFNGTKYCEDNTCLKKKKKLLLATLQR